MRFVGEAAGLRGGALERQIAEVVEQTRLTGVRHRCISALSKGYRQRVGIAQALLGSPRVIVTLMTPHGGAATLQIIEIREHIRQLGTDPYGSVPAPTSRPEVQTICDQIPADRPRKLAAFGAPGRAGEPPRSPPTRSITLTAEGTEEQVRALLTASAPSPAGPSRRRRAVSSPRASKPDGRQASTTSPAPSSSPLPGRGFPCWRWR
ncbi:MAG: hypothetical protein ACLRWQ_01935 [Flavonifractor plautii]